MLLDGDQNLQTLSLAVFTIPISQLPFSSLRLGRRPVRLKHKILISPVHDAGTRLAMRL
jgi:hypothetical protein